MTRPEDFQTYKSKNIKNPPGKKNLNELVGDQPGFSWSLIGILVALFMGFAVRALMAPERVRTQMKYAVSRIHHEFAFHFEDGYVSLADGIIPEFSIVAKGIRFNTESSCWGKVAGEINELRLPISFSHLLQGAFYVHEIEVDELQLTFRSKVETCKETTAIASGSNAQLGNSVLLLPQDKGSTPVLVAKPTETPPVSGEGKYIRPEKTIRNTGAVDEISIQTIRINYEPVAFTSLEIQNFQLLLKQTNPRLATLSGRVALFGETLSGEYSSRANVTVNVLEGTDTAVDLAVSGNWREGYYSAKLNYKLASRVYDFIGEMEHIPLSQVFPILKKYRLLQEDFNAKQIWASLKLSSSGKDPQSEEVSATISDFKLEGEVGRVDSKVIEIESLQPFKVKPINVQLTGLDFDKLFAFLNRPHPSTALGRLGSFSGSAYVKDPENIELIGEHTGLEFIFANKGNREHQVISLISGEMHLENNNWKVKVNRIRPLEGVFEGSIYLKADREWRNLDLDLNLDELVISPKVQRLMSSGGEFGSLSGDLSAAFRQGDLETLKGVLKMAKFDGDGVLAQGSKIKFDTKEKVIEMDISMGELGISLSSEAGRALRPLIDDSMLTGGSLLLKNPVGKVRTAGLEWMEWKGLQGTTANGRISSSGKWDGSGQLSGAVSVRRQKAEFNWKLSGARNRPQFIELSKKQ